ncbi:MAG TPA: hypothetical protein VNM90_05720 [Haliangium sp.]|nr:hypothetical protein [Haliangium sp.]
MLSTSGPWVTLGHAERLTLESLLSTAGMVRFIESVHADLLAALTDGERERLGLLRDGLGLKNLRHNTLARIIWHGLLTHEHLHGDTAEGRAVAEVRGALFPDDLRIVHASYRESAGRAAVRAASLTSERSLVLASIPVQGSNLLVLTMEWNEVGVEMGDMQDQRVTPGTSAGERVTRRKARDRWIRAINGVIGALRFEAEVRPEAERILERIAGIQGEVRRRLRASNGAPDGNDDPDGGPDEPDDATDAPGGEHEALPATSTESR